MLVLAGGSGTRFGAGRNKVYLPLAGRTVLSWSLNTFAALAEPPVLLLVARAGDRDLVAEVLAREVAGAPVEVVDGGASRQDSELCGLRHLAPRIQLGEIDTVLIHDGARPLVSAQLVGAVVGTARAHGGAVPGLPRTGMVRVSPDGRRLLGAAPDGLVAVQTPQAFAARPLLAAYEQAERAGFSGTDTASCVRHFTDVAVHCVPGDEHNFKITYARDLRVAEAVLAHRPR